MHRTRAAQSPWCGFPSRPDVARREKGGGDRAASFAGQKVVQGAHVGLQSRANRGQQCVRCPMDAAGVGGRRCIGHGQRRARGEASSRPDVADERKAVVTGLPVSLVSK